MKTLYILRSRVVQVTLATDVYRTAYPGAVSVDVDDATVVAVGDSWTVPVTDLGTMTAGQLAIKNAAMAAGIGIPREPAQVTVNGVIYTLVGGRFVAPTPPPLSGGGNGGTVIPFSTALDFRGSYDMGLKFVTGPIAMTADLTGAVAGRGTRITFVANAANVPTPPAGVSMVEGRTAYDNSVAGYRNWLDIWWDGAGIVGAWSQPATQTVITQPAEPVAPSFSAAPVITGTPTVGVATAYTPGTAAGSPTPTRTRQWTLDGVDISGATGATYTPVAGDVGKALRVRDIASNTSGSPATSTSPPVTVIAAASTLSPLALTVRNLLTDNGNGTYSGQAGTSLTQRGAPSAPTFVAGSDGWSGAVLYAANGPVIIAIATDQTTAYDSLRSVVINSSGQVHYRQGGVPTAIEANGVDGTAYRIARIGTALVIQKLAPGADVVTGWVTIHTFSAAAPAGDIYTIYYTTATGTIVPVKA